MAADHVTQVRIPHVPPVHSGDAGFLSSRLLQGYSQTTQSAQLARHYFTVRTKEPADVFPLRARLGPPRIITGFA